MLFAGMWDFRRKGWTFRSGGDGPTAPSASGMFRSTDGGTTWTPMTSATNKGLPPGPWGRVEVTVAPSDPKVVYSLIESTSSALYRSGDGGVTWERRDDSQHMVWRPFYFARLVVDPLDADRLFKPDLRLIVSLDGGRSFSDSLGRLARRLARSLDRSDQPLAHRRRRRRRPVDLRRTAAAGGGSRTTCRCRSSTT